MANILTMAEISKIETLHFDAGWSQRRIARELGHNRETVAKYVHEAEARRRLDSGGGDSKPANSTAGNEPAKCGRQSECAKHGKLIGKLLEKGLTADGIWRQLRDEHEFAHSYESVKRYVRKFKARQPKRIWRVECEAGEEAQVDFGVARTLRTADGKLRSSNVLRVTLSFSRKAYTETLLKQDTECLIRGLENAFRHFGGVPATLRLDNLKAAVKQADWYDPELNPKMQAFAEHYAVVILPTRPYRPEHKGKVESDISYVKSSALKGREFTSISEQNAFLKKWEAGVADRRIHGTTRKQVEAHFQEHEKAALKPLAQSLFPCFQEARRKVHRDSYIEVQRAYYEVPPEHIGRQLWVRWDSKMVRVFDEQMRAIVSHVRLEAGKFSHSLGARGQRKDSPYHTSLWWIDKAALFGPQAEEWAVAMSRNRPEHCIRVLQGLWSLNDKNKHSAASINEACAVALSHGSYTLGAVRGFLKAQQGNQNQAPFQQTMSFIEEHPIIRPLSDYGRIVMADPPGQPW